jgi:hypothetical protein
MIFAVWRRGPPHADPASSAARATERLDSDCGSLWAAAPARLERRGLCGVAWQYASGPVAEGQEPPGPHVELTPSSLRVTSGPIPQYPLYYYRAPDDSRFVVCSELAPLVELVGTADVDLVRLVAMLAWQRPADPGATPYVGLRRILPCESIRVDAQGVRSTLRVPRAGSSYLRATPRELALELRSRLEASVARAMGDANRVAVHVGGGLDSSGVLAVALASSRAGRRRELEAIAEVWASPGDDRPHLATLERELGIVAVRVGARDAAPWFSPSLCMDGQPQPFPGTCLDAPLWAASVARGAEVTLVGHAGDEICGGDISFAPLVLRGRPVHAVLEALRLRMPWHVSPLDRLAHWVAAPLVRPLVPQSWLVAELRRRRRKRWMTPRFVELLEPSLEALPRRQPRTPDEAMAHLCAHPFLTELAVSWGQIAVATAAAPVDVFRDLELVRFMARVDPLVVSHGHLFRGLYRLAMKGVLPESVRMRRDKAYAQPAIGEAAVAAGAEPRLRDLSSLERLASLGLVEPDAFRAPFDAWLRTLVRGERLELDPTDGTWDQIWPLLSAEAFLRARDASQVVASAPGKC